MNGKCEPGQVFDHSFDKAFASQEYLRGDKDVLEATCHALKASRIGTHRASSPIRRRIFTAYSEGDRTSNRVLPVPMGKSHIWFIDDFLRNSTGVTTLNVKR